MIEKIYDKSFNQDIFISKVDRIFMMVLESIMHRDPKIVDHYVSDDVYKRITDLSNDYKEKKSYDYLMKLMLNLQILLILNLKIIIYLLL